jgi:hypothetical protein
MNKRIGLLLNLLVAATIVSQGQKSETEYFTARYTIEAAGYAMASLEILETNKLDNPGALMKFTQVLDEYVNKTDVSAWLSQYSENLVINEVRK